MDERKGRRILGALVVAALTLYTSLPASGGSTLLISNMLGQLRQACRSAGDLTHACLATVGFFQVTFHLDILDPDNGDLAVQRMSQALAPFAEVDLAPGEDSCDACVQAVTEIEIQLATNGTAAEIISTLDDACDRRFPKDAARAAQCASEIGNVPSLIDFFLTNAPPVTACQEIGICPQ